MDYRARAGATILTDLSRAQMERLHNTGSTALSISRDYCWKRKESFNIDNFYEINNKKYIIYR